MPDIRSQELTACVKLFSAINPYLIDDLHQAKQHQRVGAVVAQTAAVDRFHHLPCRMPPLIIWVLLFDEALDKAAHLVSIEGNDLHAGYQVFCDCLRQLRQLSILNFPAGQHQLVLILSHHLGQLHRDGSTVRLVNLIQTIAQEQHTSLRSQRF